MMQQPVKKRTIRDAAREGKTTAAPGKIPILTHLLPVPACPQPSTGGTKTVIIRFACGHEVEAKISKKNTPDRPCPSCRVAAEAQRQAHAKARNASIKGGVPPAPRTRLPDKSRLDLTYDANRELWIGELLIGPLNNDRYAAVFDDTARALFTLCSKLDRQYRAWATAQAATKVSADAQS